MTSALFGLPDGSGDSWFGQLFVMACYGYILYLGAVLIGDGSEKLLLIYGPGIVGGLVIPILGAVPDGAIVLVSGLGSASEAQCQVSTGVGTLAGSTIMLLTIPWSISLFLGCRDKNAIGEAASFDNGRPKYTEGFKLFESCVTTYKNTVYSAKIMMATSVLYLIVLIPAIVNKSKSAAYQIQAEQYPAMAGFIACAVAFFAYSIFQLVDSKAQTTQQLKQTKLQFLRWKESVGRKIATTDNAVRIVFRRFDKDNNGTIDRQELKEGFKALGLELDRSQVMRLMEQYNVDDDKDTLTEEEFSGAIKKWSTHVLSRKASINLTKSRRKLAGLSEETEDIEMKKDDDDDDNTGGDDTAPLTKGKQKKGYQAVDMTEDDEQKIEKDEEYSEIRESSADDAAGHGAVEKLLQDLQMENEMEMEEEEEEEYLHLTDKQLIGKACWQLFLGTFLVVIFSDPMVSVIGEFSDTINVSSFFVSFIVTPVASNASEIYSSLLFAKKKSKEGISMGFSALYGAACMNNTFVLCIFCALVYFRELEWTFVAETIVILLTLMVVGVNGLRKTVVVWQGFLVILLWPLSLVLVALLDNVLDDSTSC